MFFFGLHYVQSVSWPCVPTQATLTKENWPYRCTGHWGPSMHRQTNRHPQTKNAKSQNDETQINTQQRKINSRLSGSRKRFNYGVHNTSRYTLTAPCIYVGHIIPADDSAHVYGWHGRGINRRRTYVMPAVWWDGVFPSRSMNDIHAFGYQHNAYTIKRLLYTWRDARERMRCMHARHVHICKLALRGRQRRRCRRHSSFGRAVGRLYGVVGVFTLKWFSLLCKEDEVAKKNVYRPCVCVYGFVYH